MILIEEHLSKAVCEGIRSTYDDALSAGRVCPNGNPGRTDFPLSVIWSDTNDLVIRTSDLLRRHLSFASLQLDYCAYTRLLPGNHHELHADAFRLDGSPNHTPLRVATALIYLSDDRHDFTNGVLRFPELGVEVHARTGLLVGFPTDLRHQHEVSVVASGVRDAIAVWFN